jgi:aspartyl-tRNA synthetase
MEMAFGSEEDVMEAVEKLLRNLWHRILKQKTPEQFPRMTYHDAMASYGSDKPDLRYKSKVRTH